MSVPSTSEAPWLLLVFSLPAKSASQRVQIWRKLQRYGMLPLRSSGYVLPNTAPNQERMEWLATAIRTYKGQASVVQAQGFDDLSSDRLKQLFIEARSRDYQRLLHEAKKILAIAPSRRPGGALNRIRRRFLELQDIDFFENTLRGKIENLLAHADQTETTTGRKAGGKSGEYVNRVWMTRLRPGIDRVSSAWLIRRFIDPKARFIFSADPSAHTEAKGRVVPPAVLSMHTEGGGFHIKAGLLELGRLYFAAKVNGNFPENGSRFELPTIQGVIILCDAENGTPLAVMDSRDITSLRTAAASAVAAKFLARHDSRIITVCGCGNQGRIQLKALSRVCHLETVFAYDKDSEQVSRFSHDLASELEISVKAVSDLTTAVRQSDICVTCTTSLHPLLGADDVSPGTFIAAVGADSPQKQELHPSLMATSKIVCDMFEQCAVMGDLHHALEAGFVTRASVYAELGEVVAGKKPGRESQEEIIIFDSTGVALQDVAAAAFLYEKAQRDGSGVRLNLAA